LYVPITFHSHLLPTDVPVSRVPDRRASAVKLPRFECGETYGRQSRRGTLEMIAPLFFLEFPCYEFTKFGCGCPGLGLFHRIAVLVLYIPCSKFKILQTYLLILQGYFVMSMFL